MCIVKGGVNSGVCVCLYLTVEALRKMLIKYCNCTNVCGVLMVMNFAVSINLQTEIIKL